MLYSIMKHGIPSATKPATLGWRGLLLTAAVVGAALTSGAAIRPSIASERSINNNNRQRVLRSDAFGLGQERDCTPVFLQMIEAARDSAGPTRLEIQPGVYHCYPEKAYQKYCYISNHDDGLRSTPFPLIGMHDLEIIGNGVELVCHGLMVPFLIEGSRNLNIQGFRIDWELPLHCEVSVVAVYPKQEAFDVRIKPSQPYEIRNGELLFLREGYELNLDRNLCWDPATMAVAYPTVGDLTLMRDSVVRFEKNIPYLYPTDSLDAVHRHRGREIAITATELEPGLVRLTGKLNKLPKTGWVLVAKGKNGFNRLAPAVRIAGCTNVCLQHVTVHHAGGMGLIAERSTNVTLDHFAVRLPPGKGRHLTTTADATHFNNCRGLIRLVDCYFENMLDDGTNIHGVYTMVQDVLDKHTVGLRIGHFQQMGYEFAGPGDRIGFVDPKGSFYPFITHTTERLEKINQRYYRLTFRESLDPQIAPGMLMDNLDWYPEVEVLRTKVINNRARGLLLSSPRRTVVEGCTFSNMMNALSMGVEFGGSWFESGHARDLVIRNNTFLDCGYHSPKGAALIRLGAAKSADAVVFDKLVIQDNRFRTFDPAILSATRVGSLVFRNNTIEKSDAYPVLNPNNPILHITRCDEVVIEDNTFDTPFGNKLEIDDISRRKLRQTGNNGLE